MSIIWLLLSSMATVTAASLLSLSYTEGESSRSPAPDSLSDSAKGVILFEYNDNEPIWYAVSDDVMGGISTSMVSTDPEKRRLTFSGNLSLERNGGFASIRSQWADYDLSAYDGIALRVRGDGKVYQFRVRTETTGTELAYAALFQTEKDAWKEIYLPFSKMVPIYRGAVVPGAPAIDPASIRSFGLMLANKQQGEFLLEVDPIGAVIDRTIAWPDAVAA
jgi:NADH dehydrogenase [ubiquinone] 1 alpha subcomplex assembly factor 1